MSADRNDTNGASAALAMLAASGVDLFGADGAGEQDDLFEAVTAGPLDGMPAKGQSGPRGGRPVNARNKSTEAHLRLFLSQNRAPMMVMGDIIRRDLGELTDYLQGIADKHKRVRYTENGYVEQVVQISPMDVLRLQADLLKALLPYVNKKQPVALEVDPGAGGLLLMTGFAGDDQAGGSLDLAIVDDDEENQRVSDAEIVQSDDEKSDG